MYNDEKKLITDVRRKKELDKNLKAFADVVFKADFEYACQKFMLNYITVNEMLEEKEKYNDPYVKECVDLVNKLVKKYLIEDTNELSVEDRNEINNMRDEIIKKMKILTAYTDGLEIYEYILNRKEYGYVEMENTEVDEMFAGYNHDAFAQSIFSYVFADQDKIAINAKLQSIIGQLPIRMTKTKFYDILGQTLTIYNGMEMGSFREFTDMVMQSALISKPDGFDTEYPVLFEAYNTLNNAEYTDLDFDGYRELRNLLNNTTTIITDTVTDYMMLMEIVNDLYAMALSAGVKKSCNDSTVTALKVISGTYEAIINNDEMDTDLYDLLMELEGKQEEAGEHKIMLESTSYEINTSYYDELVKNSLVDTYRDIDVVDKLLSGSLFVDVVNMSNFDTMPVSSEVIANAQQKLEGAFADLFAQNKIIVNRSIMAKILSNIPVFFNSQDEIKEYIEYSLDHCNNESELKACYVVINEMMEV